MLWVSLFLPRSFAFVRVCVCVCSLPCIRYSMVLCYTSYDLGFSSPPLTVDGRGAVDLGSFMELVLPYTLAATIV